MADRPIGSRSISSHRRASAAALVLSVANGGDTQAAFWVLVSAGVIGVMFSLIERTTTRGAEVVSHRRVNLDVLGTVLLAVVVNLVVHIAQR